LSHPQQQQQHNTDAGTGTGERNAQLAQYKNKSKCSLFVVRLSLFFVDDVDDCKLQQQSTSTSTQLSINYLPIKLIILVILSIYDVIIF
jgi:hypothetical protein